MRLVSNSWKLTYRLVVSAHSLNLWDEWLLLELWTLQKKPRRQIGMDFIGPIRGIYRLVVIDIFSRFFRLKAPNSRMVVIALQKWADTFGLFEGIITDGERYFDNKLLLKWFWVNQVEDCLTLPYKHQTNGVITRAIRDMMSMVRKYWAKETINLGKAVWELWSGI